MADVKLVRGTIGGVTVQTSERIAERLGARFEPLTASSAAEGYEAMKVADLRAEIDRRNDGRDEADLLSLDGRKPDLVATLKADDAAQAEL